MVDLRLLVLAALLSWSRAAPSPDYEEEQEVQDSSSFVSQGQVVKVRPGEKFLLPCKVREWLFLNFTTIDELTRSLSLQVENLDPNILIMWSRLDPATKKTVVISLGGNLVRRHCCCCRCKDI